MQNDDIRLSQHCSNLDSFPEWIVYSYTFWLCNAASATVGEPCNSLGLVAHRPEWCCVGFSVMGQNGPSCGTQSIHCFDQHSTSATHISNTRHPQAHTHTCTLIPSVVFFYSLAHENMHIFHKWFTQRRSMPKWSAADRVLPHGGIKHYRWELQRMCEHADRDTGRRRDKDREWGMQNERKKRYIRNIKAVLQSNWKKKKEQRGRTNEEKGVKLTCPAAGGACPPSPGVGLAGLC